MADKNWIEKIMESDVNLICIEKDEYDCLIEAQIHLNILTNLLFKNASLSWDKKNLSFSSSHSIHDFIEMMYGMRYLETLKALQEAENEKSDQAEE